VEVEVDLVQLVKVKSMLKEAVAQARSQKMQQAWA
jgi:hypothetical protein